MTRRRRHLRTKRAVPRPAVEHPCCRGIGGHEDWCNHPGDPIPDPAGDLPTDIERAAWIAEWNRK